MWLQGPQGTRWCERGDAQWKGCEWVSQPPGDSVILDASAWGM